MAIPISHLYLRGTAKLINYIEMESISTLESGHALWLLIGGNVQ